MKNLVSLKLLLQKLNNNEIKNLYKDLELTNNSNKNSNFKSIRLIELLLHDENHNSIAIQKSLYDNKINYSAFNKLIERLRNRILENLLNENNLSNGSYTERIRVIFDLRKKLIQCDLLNLKGLRDDADSLCRKIITKSNKYELYDITVQALIIRLRFVKMRRHTREVSLIQQEIIQVENRLKSFNNSQSIFNDIITKFKNSYSRKIYINDLKLAIDKIQLEFNNSNSANVKYFLLFLKTEYYQVNNQYLLAAECLNEMEILINKKSIYSDNRLGTILLNISSNCIHLMNFKDAILYAKKSLKFFPNNIVNQSLVEECIFYANYYLKNFDLAKETVLKCVRIPSANNSIFNINKWKYFLAIINFNDHKYKECLEILDDLSEIDIDKEGWNINKRLLQIMCRIELREYEISDSLVMNMEKYIKRRNGKYDIRIRYSYILKVLIKLINSNYNFTLVKSSRNKYLNSLSSNDLNIKLNLKSPELISFTDWFNGKVKFNIESTNIFPKEFIS